MCHPISSAAGMQRQSANASAAKLLNAQQRQELAIEVMAGNQSISYLAETHAVGRKFVAQQVRKAEQALADAFVSPGSAEDQVLFYLPVTKRWLRSLILALL